MQNLQDKDVYALFVKTVGEAPLQSKLLQIGANDGKAYDPVFNIIRQRTDIHVTLIEPILEYFKYLVQNYSYRENVTFLNVAISDKSGIASLRYIPVNDIQPNNLPNWVRGIATMERNRNAMDATYSDFTGEKRG